MNSTIKRLTRLLPTPVYIRSREFSLSLLDGIDWVSGRREPLIPPRSMMLDGPASVREYKQNGQLALKLFCELGGLRPGSAVLDVGSGLGRKTLPLIDYLGEHGRYDGIDIFQPGVQWCQENITSRHPNFRFQLLDVYNKYYNDRGRSKANEVRFPFEDHSFDFVILTSVFTHMLPEDVDHYLSEIKRVSKPGATSYISYFLLNGESSSQITSGTSKVEFRFTFGEHRVEKVETPEDAICLSETFVRSSYKKNGLTIEEPIRYGSWSGSTQFTDYQDIIIAKG